MWTQRLRAFWSTSAFLFLGSDGMLRPYGAAPSLESRMKEPNLTMAEKVALAAQDFQQKQTGHLPKAVTVVLSGDTLVITLHEALTPAERALSKTPEGAARVQEFH